MNYLDSKSGALRETRTPGLLVRRYTLQNSKCCFWCRLQGNAPFISLLSWTEVGPKLDRSWPEMGGVNPLDGTVFAKSGYGGLLPRQLTSGVSYRLLRLPHAQRPLPDGSVLTRNSDVTRLGKGC